jgi:HK97 family phage prohead protease
MDDQTPPEGTLTKTDESRAEPAAQMRDHMPITAERRALAHRERRAKTLDGTMERRSANLGGCELRSLDDGVLRVGGYASITERAYPIADFEETIARGALKRTLSEDPDTILLGNHMGYPLARTRSGTLALGEDPRGFRWDADLEPTDPDVQQIEPKMRRGDLSGSSFAFLATSQEWNENYTQRRITSLSVHKGDVSIVNFGANDAAFSTLSRSAEALGMVVETLEQRSGRTFSAANLDGLTQVLKRVAAADVELDAVQPMLATILGVANPDVDDEAGERSAEQAPSIPWRLPDYATRDRERLTVLMNGGRRR